MRKNKKLKIKKGAWFRATRKSYLPCAWQGWALYFIAIAYLCLAFVHNYSRDLHFGWLVFIMATDLFIVGLVLTWIATKKS